MRKCLNCEAEFCGRSDKKFCSRYCKSNFNYEQAKSETSLYKDVLKTLQRNRKILRDYNKDGKTTIRESSLLDKGFEKNYFTNYWRSKNGSVYYFCFEQGYRAIPNSSPKKYILVQWQDYMKHVSE